MNVYCEVCHGEMEIMRDLGTELHVYPCGCSGKQASRPTQAAPDVATPRRRMVACPNCETMFGVELSQPAPQVS